MVIDPFLTILFIINCGASMYLSDDTVLVCLDPLKNQYTLSKDNQEVQYREKQLINLWFEKGV